MQTANVELRASEQAPLANVPRARAEGRELRHDQEVMGQDTTQVDDRFRPMRRASGLRLVAAVVLGPLMWVVGFAIVAVVVHKSNAVEFGLLIAIGSILVAAPLLILGRLGRRREERRYAARG